MSDNDDLFAMVYFSALEVKRLDLTMSWDNKNLGSWSHDNDRWDFDLKPWVEKGKRFATVSRAKNRCAWAALMWRRPVP